MIERYNLFDCCLTGTASGRSVFVKGTSYQKVMLDELFDPYLLEIFFRMKSPTSGNADNGNGG